MRSILRLVSVYALEGLHVQFLLIAENHVTAGLGGHALVGEFHDIFERQVRQGVVNALVDVVVDAAVLSSKPSIDDAEASGTKCG